MIEYYAIVYYTMRCDKCGKPAKEGLTDIEAIENAEDEGFKQYDPYIECWYCADCYAKFEAERGKNGDT